MGHPTPLLAIRPYGNAGWKLHLTEDQPQTRASMGIGNMVLRCVPMCRKRKDGTLPPNTRRTDHLIAGGPHSPTPWREAIETHVPEAYVCIACALRAEERDA